MTHQTQTYLGRPVSRIVTVEKDGDFQSYREAERILEAEGHITGSMCSPEPTGFAPAADYEYIAKWRNLSSEDRRLLHGVIRPAPGNPTSGSRGGFRNGPLEILYFGDI